MISIGVAVVAAVVTLVVVPPIVAFLKRKMTAASAREMPISHPLIPDSPTIPDSPKSDTPMPPLIPDSDSPPAATPTTKLFPDSPPTSKPEISPAIDIVQQTQQAGQEVSPPLRCCMPPFMHPTKVTTA